MADLDCPYCDAEIDICTDDGHGCTENIVYQEECWSCGKLFTFTTYFSQSFEAEKADCLNGDEHEWKESITSYKEHASMTCRTCDERRCLTEAEELKYYGAAEDGKSY